MNNTSNSRHNKSYSIFLKKHQQRYVQILSIVGFVILLSFMLWSGSAQAANQPVISNHTLVAPTSTATTTATSTATVTATATATEAATASATSTAVVSSTTTATATATASATGTAATSPTVTATSTGTTTPTVTATSTGTVTPTVTATATSTGTVTPTVTATSSVTPTATPTPGNPDLKLALVASTNMPHAGQALTYALEVSNNSAAAAIPAGQPIIVSFGAPAGVNITSVSGDPEWLVSYIPCPSFPWSVFGHFVCNRLVASYVGAYPIAPGQTLIPIVVHATATHINPTAVAIGTVSTPHDSNLSDNTVSISQNILGPSEVTFWVQTLSSCHVSIPGMDLELTGNGLDIIKGLALRKGKVASLPCPFLHADCIKAPIGCISWQLPVPEHGSVTYMIKERRGYASCSHHVQCPINPEFMKITVNADGSVSAITIIPRVKGAPDILPKNGTFTGQKTDPAIFSYLPPMQARTVIHVPDRRQVSIVNQRAVVVAGPKPAHTKLLITSR